LGDSACQDDVKELSRRASFREIARFHQNPPNPSTCSLQLDAVVIRTSSTLGAILGNPQQIKDSLTSEQPSVAALRNLSGRPIPPN
jgi:hypothetical protein